MIRGGKPEAGTCMHNANNVTGATSRTCHLAACVIDGMKERVVLVLVAMANCDLGPSARAPSAFLFTKTLLQGIDSNCNNNIKSNNNNNNNQKRKAHRAGMGPALYRNLCSPHTPSDRRSGSSRMQFSSRTDTTASASESKPVLVSSLTFSLPFVCLPAITQW